VPRASHKWETHPDIRVRVRNPQGRYLAQDAGGLFFTDDPTRAVVLDLKGDEVEEQLRKIRDAAGVVLVADPVPLEEIYENCDRCKDLFMPFMIVFDGRRFLCPDCLNARLPGRRA